MQTSEPRRAWVVRSPSDLGRAIAGVRGERDISQDELAAALGVHRSYLAKMEAGPAPIFVERALQALRRLGATVTVTLPQDDAPEN